MSTDNSLACASQCRSILEYMQQGNKINPMKALGLCGCLRLAARIADLKHQGWDIHSKLVFIEKDGVQKKYKEYWLEQV